MAVRRLFIAACVLACAASVHADPITYTILDRAGSLTITGTLTTDGAGGAISNILDWALTVSGDQPFTADPTNSAFRLETPILKPGVTISDQIFYAGPETLWASIRTVETQQLLGPGFRTLDLFSLVDGTYLWWNDFSPIEPIFGKGLHNPLDDTWQWAGARSMYAVGTVDQGGFAAESLELVPEPSSLLLFGTGLCALLRRKQAR